jgi:putative transposase
MLISITPPKYSVAQVVGFIIKGRSAIYVASRHVGKGRNFVGENFWARGYFVSTVGRDEEEVRKCIKEKEKENHEWIDWICLNRTGHFEWLTVTEQPP